jgi:hypothetical protein
MFIFKKSWLFFFSLVLVLSLFLSSGPVVLAARSSPVTIDNPYGGGIAYKGQLHAHTENCSAAALETAYRNAGYQFMAITDHNKWTSNPGVPGIIHLDGIEKTVTEGHEKIVWTETATGKIEYIEANHPNRTGNLWTNAELTGNTQVNGLEVYNPSPTSISEDKWDYALLNPYKRKIWGSAVDDYHGTSSFSGGKGWVMAYASSYSASEIMKSLKTGNFYATTGPVITVKVVSNRITITTDKHSNIDWKQAGGKIIKTATGGTASFYQANGQEGYIRAVITHKSDGKKAWTQPFFVNR